MQSQKNGIGIFDIVDIHKWVLYFMHVMCVFACLWTKMICSHRNTLCLVVSCAKKTGFLNNNINSIIIMIENRSKNKGKDEFEYISLYNFFDWWNYSNSFFSSNFVTDFFWIVEHEWQTKIIFTLSAKIVNI